MSDVLGYLLSKGVATKRADSRNIHAPCFFCDEAPDRRGRLYVNIDPEAEIPGLFYCHLCGHKGSLASIKQHFGDTVAEPEADTLLLREILESAADFYAANLARYPDVMAYLTGPKRGLTPETIKAFRFGYAPMELDFDVATERFTVTKPNRLYRALRDQGYDAKDILDSGLCYKVDNRIVDSLAGMITIPYLVARNVVTIRGRTWPHDQADFAGWSLERYEPAKGKYKTLAGSKARLFNTDACWDAKEILIAEGEMDAVVLQQHGFPAVGVPGASSWQNAWDDYVHPLKRVWLVFDRDQEGERGANKLVERFGASKVRRINLSPEGVKCDPTQWFSEGHTAEEFREILDEARRGGLLVTVDEAIAEFEDIQSQPGIKFGWELLDIMIDPGLQRSQVMVILARTGTGKTLVVLNLMHRIRTVAGQENLKMLFVSLEQTRGEWWDRARRIHRFYDLESTEEDAADFWRDSLYIVDRNRLSETDFSQILEDFAYQTGQMPDLVAIDYLGYYARGFRGEPYARTSDAIMSIKGVCKEHRIAAIVPQQVNRSGTEGQEIGADAARESGVVEETADFLLTMWAPDNMLGREMEEQTGLVNMRIAKSRHGGRGQLLSMQRAPLSLAMVPEGDPLAARARQEWAWKLQYQDNWEKAVYRHLTGFDGYLDEQAGRLREVRRPTDGGQKQWR